MNGLGTIHIDQNTYRKQWATLTGRSEKGVYIPVALRDPDEDDLPILTPPTKPRGFRTTEPDPGPIPKPDPVPWPGPPPGK